MDGGAHGPPISPRNEKRPGTKERRVAVPGVGFAGRPAAAVRILRDQHDLAVRAGLQDSSLGGGGVGQLELAADHGA